mmetsp:Transcript_65167/g.146459  ORF Transcript_65167/g.146459 Transcript_65167/m.146459 type:complete len:279 (-) Transcript_65167:68-904(-)
MRVLGHWVAALALLSALPASGLRLSDVQHSEQQGFPEESVACLRNKTIFFAGNSITRGIFFTLSALLKYDDNFDAATPFWRDREEQKHFCKQGPLGLTSCRFYIKSLDLSIVYLMTQRLDALCESLQKAERRIQPDFVVAEIGLDHTTHEYNVTADKRYLFEKSLEEQFGCVANQVESMGRELHTKFIWRQVSHFNESGAWDSKWTNANVDLWNREMYEHMAARNWLEMEWFRFYSGSAELIDQALQKQDGWGMEDWVHPNSFTMAKLTRDLVNNMCV